MFVNKFLYLILLCFYAVEVEDHKTTDKKSSSSVNVVIFFTHVNQSKCASLQKNNIFEFLDLHEVTKIKHNAEDAETHIEAAKSSTEFCQQLLRDNLLSLSHYCHTALKMKTAIASISSNEIINDIQTAPSDNDDDDNPSLIKRLSRTSALNDADDYDDYNEQESSRSSSDTKNNAKNIITGSKHTEVFQIRVPRNAAEDAVTESNNKAKIIEDFPKKKGANKYPWDVLDIMKHVRYSFLGSIIEDNVQIKDAEENVVDLAKLGKERPDAGLLNMVKSTLDTLMCAPASNFFMAIFGGHLHSVTDKNSPIVQSVKYVIENVEPENLLIIVTGSCTDGKNNEDLTPLYAKGPGSDVLIESKLLYDVPLIVRKILQVEDTEGFKLPSV